MIQHPHGGRSCPEGAPAALDIRVFSEAETLIRLGVSRSHLKRLHKQGTGPARVQLGPGRIGYRAEDLATWLASRVRA